MASFAKRACPLAGYALRQSPPGRTGKAHKRACFEKSGFLADSAILLVLYTNFAQIRLLLTHILIKIYKYRCTKGIRRRWGCPQARWLRSRARQASHRAAARRLGAQPPAGRLLARRGLLSPCGLASPPVGAPSGPSEFSAARRRRWRERRRSLPDGRQGG